MGESYPQGLPFGAPVFGMVFVVRFTDLINNTEKN